jgi:spore germination protein YaaH
MIKKAAVLFAGIVIGGICMFAIFRTIQPSSLTSISSKLGMQKQTIMGFLPYWLISKAQTDYTHYVDEISYFAVSINGDGSIKKRSVPTETEPGWLALQNGKADSYKPTSLVVFSADQEAIGQLIDLPQKHATQLANEIYPVINQFKFTDLNIDIESVSLASDSARANFTIFIQTLHTILKKKNPTLTLSMDISPTALIRPYLIDVAAIAPYMDRIIFMTYDFHYQGSGVTGAVAPVNGAGVSAEYDSETSIKEAVKILPSQKVILGVPFYGYEWETLSNYPHAATIPGTGITASSRRVEELLAACATCSAQFDPVSKEAYVIYKDQSTNTYHQIFYPDKQSISEKVALMKKYKLGGIALWALGYEGNTLLEPFKK